jgi:tetratricopeptide (TPR) repeat protein
MIAYCYERMGDSTTALEFINKYFEKEVPENYVMKDYDLKARLLEVVSDDKNEAAAMYEKALAMAEIDEVKLAYMETLVNLYSEIKNNEMEALMREKIYTTRESPTNLDLYYWGVALYSNADYNKADSVFSMYAEKYPEQVFGYLWRAKAIAQIDSTMELGLAIPHYEKVIEVAEKDPEKNLANLVGAYGYIGAYKANIEKDFIGSLDCFTKILQLDEDNSDAMRYSEILKQWIDKAKTEKNETGSKENKTSTIN